MHTLPNLRVPETGEMIRQGVWYSGGSNPPVDTPCKDKWGGSLHWSGVAWYNSITGQCRSRPSCWIVIIDPRYNYISLEQGTRRFLVPVKKDPNAPEETTDEIAS